MRFASEDELNQLLIQESSANSDHINFESGNSCLPYSQGSYSKPELRSSVATDPEGPPSGRVIREARYPGSCSRIGQEIAGSDSNRPKPESHDLPSCWVNEKARYPGAHSHMAEEEGGSVSVAELPSRGGGGYFAGPFHEMYDASAPSIEPTEMPAESLGIELPGLDSGIIGSLSRQKIPQSSNCRSFSDRWVKRPQPSRSSTIDLSLKLASYSTTFPKSQENTMKQSEVFAPVSRQGTPTLDTAQGFDPPSPSDFSERNLTYNNCIPKRWAVSPTSSDLSEGRPNDYNLVPTKLKLRTDLEKPSNTTPIDSHDVPSHQCSSSAQQKFLSKTRPHGIARAPVTTSNPASPTSLRSDTPESHSTPTQTQIEELRDLVYLVNHQWMQRLASNQKLYDICSSLPVRDLFERGLRSLEQFFRDQLPTAFEDIFALMHIAFAAAYFLHKDDSSYCWSAFFQDALQWQLVLSSKPDKHSFANAMDRWWWPPGHPSTPPISNVHLTFDHLLIPAIPTSTAQMMLLTVLRNGKIIESCSGFLDGK